MRSRHLPILAAACLLLLLPGAPRLGAGTSSSPGPRSHWEVAPLAQSVPQAPAPGQRETERPSDADRLVALADEVSKEVEALRGWPFKRPVKKELTTVDQLMQYVRQQVEKTLPPGKTAVLQAFLRTIGLIPATVDLKATWLALYENQIGGFYDPDTRSMHLVARGGMPLTIERMLLAHELTHALDDQYADLQAFEREHQNESEDLSLSTTSIVEGSATALMMQYMFRAMATGKIDLGQITQYAQDEAERSKPFLDAPRYFSAMLASYMCGMQFLAKGAALPAIMAAPDNKAIGEALLVARKNPPKSSEQVLHPEKYWDPAKLDEPVPIDDGVAAKWLARSGTWIVHADTVGEVLTAILASPRASRPNLMEMQTAASWTNTAAEGWGGDRFYLVASGANRDAAARALNDVKGVWVTAWDTSKDRDEFVAALPGGSLAAGAVAATVGDAIVVVYFGVSEEERARLTKTWPSGLVGRR